jgi:hypothetical protein
VRFIVSLSAHEWKEAGDGYEYDHSAYGEHGFYLL